MHCKVRVVSGRKHLCCNCWARAASYALVDGGFVQLEPCTRRRTASSTSPLAGTMKDGYTADDVPDIVDYMRSYWEMDGPLQASSLVTNFLIGEDLLPIHE